MPKALQLRAVHWYHNVLCHPGESHRTHHKQHFTWTNMRKDVQNVCSRCSTCLLTKKTLKETMDFFQKRKQKVNPGENYVLT